MSTTRSVVQFLLMLRKMAPLSLLHLWLIWNDCSGRMTLKVCEVFLKVKKIFFELHSGWDFKSCSCSFLVFEMVIFILCMRLCFLHQFEFVSLVIEQLVTSSFQMSFRCSFTFRNWISMVIHWYSLNQPCTFHIHFFY